MLLPLALALLGPVAPRQTASCQPGWQTIFGHEPGMEDWVQALAVMDDGRLVAGGLFKEAGGRQANGVALWMGKQWTNLAGGLGSTFTVGDVRALQVCDVGGSRELYATGGFETYSRIARWDGTNWNSLGSGLSFDSWGSCLASFDDGRGSALYVGGRINTAGGTAVQNLARWNGTSWESVGGGVVGSVAALVVFDDGRGPALYVAGDFTSAGGVAASHLARWDGTSFEPLGSGTDGAVQSLAVFDDGGGPALYAGGKFQSAGGVSANSIARWDGSSWSALGGGLTGSTPPLVHALTVFDDGGGPALIAGGLFSNASGVSVGNLARWDGANWSAYGNTDRVVGSLVVHDDGSGPTLVAGGQFQFLDGLDVEYLARREAGAWGAIGRGPNDQVRALLSVEESSGAALYAGGYFTSIGGEPVGGIARWNGTNWAALGSGVDWSVEALARFDDGRGEALYAAGNFTLAGGLPANRIARWDGANWEPLGGGIPGDYHNVVQALAVFDDGTGPRLFAGGRFTQAGGVTANNIARWDGVNWSPVGSGVNGAVLALQVFDHGTGPALYAVSGGTGLARWDGQAWSAIAGTAGSLTALEVFDDGRGPALYVGLRSNDGNGLGRFDGVSWETVSVALSTNASIQALESFDDGSGPALYAALSSYGSGVLRWNGTNWGFLGNGLSLEGASALAVYDPPGPIEPGLVVGGRFGNAPDSGDSHLAVWQGCASTGPADGKFGAALSSADVNGDGYSDVIVGEPYYDEEFEDEGRVLVYLGSSSGLDRTPAWTKRGRQRHAHLGAALAGVGDVNGDSYEDLAIGAPGYDLPRRDRSSGPGVVQGSEPFDNVGLLVVFLGSPGGLRDAPALFRPGIQHEERVGAVVARAGDVDSDGFDDVLIGAPGTDGVGAAFVFHGTSSGVEPLPRWLRTMPEGLPGTRFATALAGGGDLDGDGYDDVLIGAPDAGTNAHGRIYVAYGASAGLGLALTLLTSDLPPGTGPYFNGNSDWGAALAVIGDVNGDGDAEVVVGNPNYDGNTINCCPTPFDMGIVRLYSGSPARRYTILQTRSGSAGNRLGASLGALGDIDGDGEFDAGIGEGRDLGVAFGYFGATWSKFRTFLGRGPVAAAGDVDGDGFGDVLSAEPVFGTVYLYHGTRDGVRYGGTLSAP